MQDASTIFALSSGMGRAAIAVIRVSGPAAGLVVDRMAAPRPKPRYAVFRRIRHPETAEVLDEALLLWIPGPKSETGEDMAELQIHGGGAVIRSVLAALSAIPGCRMAGPGEFVRRAFENGHISLTAIEGLADLIDAETEAQRRQAVQQAGGALHRLYDGWRERLLAARALAEAAIDFSDEGDVGERAMADADSTAAALLAELRAHLDDGHRGEIIREGFRVVLAGPPNVGKSSLMNALARRDVAIVSPEAGTTRDVLEVRLDLGGYPVVLTDTAGVRDAQGLVEREGIRRTVERVRGADLVLWVVDAGAPIWQPPDNWADASTPVLSVLNKIDLAGAATARQGLPTAIPVSASTGDGLDRLVRRLTDEVSQRLADRPAIPISQHRHRLAIEAAVTALARGLALGPVAPAELKAEDLRLATEALDQVIGRVDVEEILGAIFGRFCIGK